MGYGDALDSFSRCLEVTQTNQRILEIRNLMNKELDSSRTVPTHAARPSHPTSDLGWAIYHARAIAMEYVAFI